jgi:hypothetical protein
MFRMMVAEADRFRSRPDLYRAGPMVCRIARWLPGGCGRRGQAHDDPALAARQLLSLVKVDLHLRCLFDTGTRPTPAECDKQVAAAVEVFLKAYGAPGT